MEWDAVVQWGLSSLSAGSTERGEQHGYLRTSNIHQQEHGLHKASLPSWHLSLGLGGAACCYVLAGECALMEPCMCVMMEALSTKVT